MLEIRLLGTFDLRQAGKSIDLSSRPAQSLFAYLVLNAGIAQRREKLAGMLWPDSLEETARDNLRHALWRVRKALLSASSARFLNADDRTIKFESSSEYWLDTAVLEKVSGNETADELITILAEYEGELLPGFYDDWVVLEREHLNSVFEHHMARLMSLLQNENRWLDILDWGERWIKLGQKPELAYRALMIAHAAKGDMSRVATTFERCIKSLNEYGIEPSDQTRAIYEDLKAGKDTFGKNTQVVSFPKAREPATAPRTNIPIPLTSFIGRETQVNEIVHLLGKNRLLTLTGTGGVGKTRLAIESANQMLADFRDGVCWVDLVGLNDPSFLPQAIAQIVGVSEIPNQSLTETLIHHLQAKQILLMLDNCEHLILACAQLAGRLLSTCRELKILATSREAMDILGETTLSVPSLSLPEMDMTIPIESLNNFEGIRLFADRARLVQPGFELNDQNARTVAQICYRLSGMPLAIELAAARVKMMSVEEIAKRLDDRFGLLTSGSRTVLPRHQTLKATIDWSYELLSTLERVFFQRLSVFIGGFTAKAAEEITVEGDIEKEQAIDLLRQLINKSLVSVDAPLKHTGETRYGMLETIREYANRKLIESGEADKVRDRHLLYFMRLAEQAQPEIFLSSQIAWLDLLEIELENLRAAMGWSMVNEGTEIVQLEAERRAGGLRLAAALAWFWERRYRWEAIEQLRAMLLKLETMQDSPVHIMMFSAIGFLYWSAGEYGEARTYLEKAVSTGRKFAKSLNLAWALNYLGATALAQGDQKTAQSSLDEAFDMATGLGLAGKHVMGWALAFLGDIPYLNRDFAKAESMYELSIMAFGEVGNLNLKAYPLRRLGYLTLHQGNAKKAAKFFTESLLLNHKLQHQVGTIGSVAAFGGLSIALQNYTRSAKLLGAVEAHLEARALRLLPSDRIEYTHTVTVLKAQIDQQTLADAWAEGRSMPLEKVVDFALTG